MPKASSHEDTRCAIDTEYDRRAIDLIRSHGVLSQEDGGPLDVIRDLVGEEVEGGAIDALLKQLKVATGDVARRRIVSAFEAHSFKRAVERTDVAYRLGIAVGRRIGGAR